ncbi:hypothetical protein KI387_002582, partial [Taxus chinensis]
DAFSKFIGLTVSSACSSRTDAGVHALANVCHVDVERISKRKPGEVKNAGDMSVVDVRCVPINFHARFRAQERTYYYRILSGKEPLSTFEKDRSWHVPEDLNLSLMQEACKVLVGHHDFSSFRASGCQAKSPIKTLTELHVHEIAAWPAFPSSIDRNGRVDVPDKNHAHLSCEGKANLDKPLQREGNLSLSREDPMEHKMPVTHCQEHENYKGEGLHFGRRRGHCGYVVTARAPSFLYHQRRESIWGRRWVEALRELWSRAKVVNFADRKEKTSREGQKPKSWSWIFPPSIREICRSEGRPAANFVDYDKCYKEALLLLKLSVSDDMISEVRNATVANTLWTSLRDKYQTSEKSPVLYLKNMLFSVKLQEGGSLFEHLLLMKDL